MTNIKLEMDFLYIYGFILAEELQKSEVPSILGIDQRMIAVKLYKDVAAIMTLVDSNNYSQQHINLQLKDAEWLKEKAFHHHEVISNISQHFTIIPMSFCTIYQNEMNFESLVANRYERIHQRLLALKDKQEWNVKMFCHKSKALAYVMEKNAAVLELKEKLAFMPKGKQFLMKKKLESLIADQFEIEQSKWCRQINDQVTSFVSETNLRRNWGKEVTERKDDMIINCDYLIEARNIDSFLEKMKEVEQGFEEMGCMIQITGPWPPYHFSKMESS